MTTKRSPSGSVSTADMGSIRLSMACTQGPQARKRSATDWSVMDSDKAVKMPATSRKDLSKPQYKKTTRKSCSGVLTFLGLTNALNSRAICTVAGQGHSVFRDKNNTEERQRCPGLSRKAATGSRDVGFARP